MLRKCACEPLAAMVFRISSSNSTSPKVSFCCMSRNDSEAATVAA